MSRMGFEVELDALGTPQVFEQPEAHRVLVTGASGILGQGVARALLASGSEVVTLQRRPSGVEGAEDVRGSVADPEAVARAMDGVDTVVHVAAKVSVSGREEEFELINVAGTQYVVEAARDAGVSRMVHISSPSVAHAGSSIVGEGAGPADPAAARGPYARTKAAGELIALSADSPSFHVLALRPHLMWGPGDMQLTDRIVQRARAGRMPVLGSGAALVDTLYTWNAVEAVLAAVTAADHTHGESLVVTNGEPRPVGELITRIAMAGGAAPPRLRLPAGVARRAGALVERAWERNLFGMRRATADGEPPLTEFLAEQLSTSHWFDQRRTREVLDWRPRVSIDEGLERVAEHYAER
ncbi:NAD(P)-dependent oxidoreductase [Micrococcus sp. FDAARGOS_333]|uniref:NAD-dependent epimerase/dehydratase family protein n=1 Tax=Micrococcus sp. FDAARGOS_333 TaxID=1930558 RepID=UPI000B4E31DD|nr:NAD-dependent epimerase/dehydratase family protein [Micrococcus sp. FDAARGOS_333]PNL18141.1 nucleoside-diphosphate sugar epimerase [Micrococcus sp. FDAARGOS_333]